MRFVFHRDLPSKGIHYSKAQIVRRRKLSPDDVRKFPDPVEGLGKEKPYVESEIDAYVARQISARETEHEAAA
jgi:hypothetical protein